MRFSPVWPEANRFFELFGCLLGLTFVFQCERQILVSVGIVGFEFQGFAVVGNRRVPGFLTGKFDGLFAIGVGGLGEARSGEEKSRSHQNHRSTAEVEQQVRPVSLPSVSALSVTAGERLSYQRDVAGPLITLIFIPRRNA